MSNFDEFTTKIQEEIEKLNEEVEMLKRQTKTKEQQLERVIASRNELERFIEAKQIEKGLADWLKQGVISFLKASYEEMKELASANKAYYGYHYIMKLQSPKSSISLGFSKSKTTSIIKLTWILNGKDRNERDFTQEIPILLTPRACTKLSYKCLMSDEWFAEGILRFSLVRILQVLEDLFMFESESDEHNTLKARLLIVVKEMKD